MLEDKKKIMSSKSIKILDDMDEKYNEMGVPDIVSVKRSSGVDVLNIESKNPTSESKGRSFVSKPI